MNARQAFLIEEECKKIVAALAIEGNKARAITAVTRRVLLNAPYFYNGRSINPKAKSLGAGVWELENAERRP